MDALRLNGPGFRVEVSPVCKISPDNAKQKASHHLMWCGNGINTSMQQNFQRRLNLGEMVMLTGFDTSLRK